MSPLSLRIGQLAKKTNTNVSMIRYYEDIGLLPRAARQQGSQRVFDQADVQRLIFIRRCRAFGFGIEQVRTLVSLVQDQERSCLEARELAFEHLQTVRAKLMELQELEKNLLCFVTECDRNCVGGPGPECVILDGLSSNCCSGATASMC